MEMRCEINRHCITDIDAGEIGLLKQKGVY